MNVRAYLIAPIVVVVAAVAACGGETSGPVTPVTPAPDAASDASEAPDAASPADSGACPHQSYWYDAPGCGASAKAKCMPPPPPCAQEFCGCDGKTIIGCGVAPAPYVHTGKCADAAP